MPIREPKLTEYRRTARAEQASLRPRSRPPLPLPRPSARMQAAPVKVDRFQRTLFGEIIKPSEPGATCTQSTVCVAAGQMPYGGVCNPERDENGILFHVHRNCR